MAKTRKLRRGNLRTLEKLEPLVARIPYPSLTPRMQGRGMSRRRGGEAAEEFFQHQAGAMG